MNQGTQRYHLTEKNEVENLVILSPLMYGITLNFLYSVRTGREGEEGLEMKGGLCSLVGKMPKITA
jgi:hypothetical protein